MNNSLLSMAIIALLFIGCESKKPHSHDHGDGHTHEHAKGTHQHEDGTIHENHSDGEIHQEEFKVNSDSAAIKDSLHKQQHDHGHDHSH